LIETVIDRWRGSTMSHKGGYEEDSAEPPVPVRDDIAAAPLQPAAPGLDPQRFRTLRKPLDAGAISAELPAQPTRRW
jgi:hypothetical protein